MNLTVYEEGTFLLLKMNLLRFFISFLYKQTNSFSDFFYFSSELLRSCSIQHLPCLFWFIQCSDSIHSNSFHCKNMFEKNKTKSKQNLFCIQNNIFFPFLSLKSTCLKALTFKLKVGDKNGSKYISCNDKSR